MADVPTTAIRQGGIAVTPDGALYVTGDAGASIGDAIGGATATRVLYVGAGSVLADSANLTFTGTATLNVGADLTTNAGSIVFSGTGGSMFSAVTDTITFAKSNTSGQTVAIKAVTNAGEMRFATGLAMGWTSAGSDGALRTALSEISSGVIGVGTGAAGSMAGTVALAGLQVHNGTSAKVAVSGTAPTLASGGCTSAAMVNNNGTARFEADVGTSCSGSQPLVFTLPATTTGWNCTAQNVSNPATSIPRQSSAVSTTSVTITSYSATTGLAQAWTDGDNVVVSCLGG